MTDARPVIFDFDGVLVRGDLFVEWLKHHLRAHPLKSVGATGLGLFSLLFTPGSQASPRLHRRAIQIAMRGLSDDEFTRSATEFAEAAALDPKIAREPAIERLREHALRGECFVVTGNERRIVEAFLGALGFGDRVRVIGSRLRMVDGNVRFIVHNIGERKVQAALAAGIRIEEATFYTDSAVDLPLAHRVRDVVVVNPSARSARSFRSNLPSATIVYWA